MDPDFLILHNHPSSIDTRVPEPQKHFILSGIAENSYFLLQDLHAINCACADDVTHLNPITEGMMHVGLSANLRGKDSLVS